jgi:hypothetical protein
MQEINERGAISNYKRFDKQQRRDEIQMKAMGEANERDVRCNRKRCQTKLNEVREGIRRSTKVNWKRCKKKLE